MEGDKTFGLKSKCKEKKEINTDGWLNMESNRNIPSQKCKYNVESLPF